jgi:hypothetical protein
MLSILVLFDHVGVLFAYDVKLTPNLFALWDDLLWDKDLLKDGLD